MMWPTMTRALVLSFLMLLLAAAPARAFLPTGAYEVRSVEGWTVRVSPKLLERPDLARQTLDLLRARLFEVNRVLPAPALEQLRGVTIWVELRDARFPGMCFHPSAEWLRGNGYNPDKAGGVEIGNAQNFLDWSDQPAMVLHELAHAYHHKVLRLGNAQVRSAHREAARSGKYDAVLRASGRTERAYALNNPEEYFAELSEAYFLTNDFFPFVRAELKQHDPKGFRMIHDAWHRPPATAPATTATATATKAVPPAPPATLPRGMSSAGTNSVGTNGGATDSAGTTSGATDSGETGSGGMTSRGNGRAQDEQRRDAAAGATR